MTANTPPQQATPAEPVPNTFKQPGESDDEWIDRITGATLPVASPIVAAQPDERAAFDAWAASAGFHSGIEPDGSHSSPVTTSAWIGWQARAALATKEAP